MFILLKKLQNTDGAENMYTHFDRRNLFNVFQNLTEKQQ